MAKQGHGKHVDVDLITDSLFCKFMEATDVRDANIVDKY